MKKILLIAFILLPAISGLKGQSLSIIPNALSLSPLDNSSGTVAITASGVEWSIADNSGGWLSFSATTGDTNAVVTITAAANASALSRSADVIVSGTGEVTPQVLVVTQDGGTLTISDSEISVPSFANSDGSFELTSNTSWSVSDNADWLTLSAINGSLDASVAISVESNPLTNTRSAEIIITGNGLAPQTITLIQEGAAASLFVSPSDLTVLATANTSGSFTISANTSWSIAEEASWLSVSLASGSGNGAITISVDENSSTSSRSAVITITATGVATPATVTVTQNAAAASLIISPASLSLAATAGSTGTFNITSNISWTILEEASWLTVSRASGSNNDIITVTAVANSSAASRSAIITVTGSGVSDQTINVTQAGAAAYLMLSPGNLSLAYSGGSTGTFNITSNTSWTVTSNQVWLSVSTAAGTNNSSILVTATANPSTSQRTATITVSGTGVTSQTVSVTQAGIPTYTVSAIANPSGAGTISGAGTYASGASVTLTAAPATGYRFVNWSEGGTAVSTSQSYTFSITANRTLVANFSLVSYTISTSSIPAGGGTTSGGGSYNYGESATVTATPLTGYRFVNWTAGGTSVSTSASYTFTVTANRTLVANFTTLTYTITTTTSPAGVGSATGGGTYNFGASATVTAAPATGYRFVNWTEGGTVVSTASSYTFTVNSNRSLLANYSINTYTVATSSSPAAGGTASGAGIYNHGTQATVTATPSAGYLFVNWTESGTSVSTNVSYSFTVTANRTLVANYSPIRYTITTASSPPAGGTTSGGGTFSPSATATVTASPATGYQFMGWTEGGSTVSTNSTYSFLVSANRNLVATFQSISYLTVNTLSNPSVGGTATGHGTYSAGTIVTVRATEATGYNFVNWSEGGSTVSSSESYTFTVNTNRTLVANFSPISYTVTTSSSPAGGGTTSGGGAFIYGDAVTVTAVPAPGYQFVNWTQGGTAVSTNSSYSFTLTGNRTLTANFSQNAYTISTSSSPANGGTTSGGGSFSYGDNATVRAVPSTGYTFVNWSQGGTVVSTNIIYSFTVTSGLTLVANFSQITYTVALSSAPAAGGTSSGAGTYGSGTTATVTATPATGYRFVNWTQGGTAASANPVYSFPVTANITLVANFAVADYTITTTASPAGAGTASGGGSFNHGASVTVRATPATGYQFTNWTENGSAVSTSANYSFTVSGSRNLLANFSQIPRLLTLTGPEGNNLLNNDILTLDNPEAGSLVITVNANADWTVTENSLWFNAIKESNSRIRINYLENISVIDKEGPLKVTTTLNAEMQVIVRQEARISQLGLSKFDDVKLYPNPAGDRTRLLFPRELQGKIRVSISSVQGINVKTAEYEHILSNQIVELDLTGIRPGQYLMIISDDTDQKTFRMIKF